MYMWSGDDMDTETGSFVPVADPGGEGHAPPAL